MSQQAWRSTRPGGVRAYVLLVLAVLAGVVAMHGLGPAVPPAPTHAMPDARHVVTATSPSHADAADCEDCVHVDHGNGDTGGHAEHADATCAAGGTSGAPALPALASAGMITCTTADATTLVPAATLGERAPPSLSELQLLRI